MVLICMNILYVGKAVRNNRLKSGRLQVSIAICHTCLCDCLHPLQVLPIFLIIPSVLCLSVPSLSSQPAFLCQHLLFPSLSLLVLLVFDPCRSWPCTHPPDQSAWHWACLPTCTFASVTVINIVTSTRSASGSYLDSWYVQWLVKVFTPLTFFLFCCLTTWNRNICFWGGCINLF